jgi:dihydrodipicolinate synthase/N-acetylneuraminate lyase
MTEKIRGIIPVLHTPLNELGGIDTSALVRIVDFLVKKSIGGLWVLGTGGEDMNLCYDKRKQVVQTVYEANAGRKPLIVGCSFYAFDETLMFLNFLNNYKLSGIHYMPYQQLISLDRVQYCYATIAERSQNPVWMYSSANWCQHIPPAFVRKMKGTKNIVGMKYSTSNAAHMSEVASLADDDFNIISAVASTLLPSLTVGVDGSTSSLAGAFPEVLIDIYEKFLNNNSAEALKAQRKLNEFVSNWPKALSKDNFLKAAEEKSILQYRDLCQRYTTSYFRDANDDEYKQIISMFKKYYPQLA